MPFARAYIAVIKGQVPRQVQGHRKGVARHFMHAVVGRVAHPNATGLSVIRIDCVKACAIATDDF